MVYKQQLKENKMPEFEDIENMLSTEEKVADELKNYLLDNIKNVSEKTGRTQKELREYIERLMVM